MARTCRILTISDWNFHDNITLPVKSAKKILWRINLLLLDWVNITYAYIYIHTKYAFLLFISTWFIKINTCAACAYMCVCVRSFYTHRGGRHANFSKWERGISPSTECSRCRVRGGWEGGTPPHQGHSQKFVFGGIKILGRYKTLILMFWRHFYPIKSLLDLICGGTYTHIPTPVAMPLLPIWLGDLREHHKLPSGDWRWVLTDHVFGAFWAWKSPFCLFDDSVTHKIAVKSGISWIPRGMVGLHLERGRIPPQKRESWQVRGGSSAVSRCRLSYTVMSILPQSPMYELWIHGTAYTLQAPYTLLVHTLYTQYRAIHYSSRRRWNKKLQKNTKIPTNIV